MAPTIFTPSGLSRGSLVYKGREIEMDPRHEGVRINRPRTVFAFAGMTDRTVLRYRPCGTQGPLDALSSKREYTP